MRDPDTVTSEIVLPVSAFDSSAAGEGSAVVDSAAGTAGVAAAAGAAAAASFAATRIGFLSPSAACADAKVAAATSEMPARVNTR
jgi:hypothetical protein